MLNHSSKHKNQDSVSSLDYYKICTGNTWNYIWNGNYGKMHIILCVYIYKYTTHTNTLKKNKKYEKVVSLSYTYSPGHFVQPTKINMTI